MKNSAWKYWTTVSLRKDTHAALEKLKGRKDAFDDVVRRLLNLGEVQG